VLEYTPSGPRNFGQLHTYLVVVTCWEALARVVVNREKYLHEMRHKRCKLIVRAQEFALGGQVQPADGMDEQIGRIAVNRNRSRPAQIFFRRASA
jgi:hypothetical protein